MIIGIEEEKGRVDSKSIPKRHQSEEEKEMGNIREKKVPEE